MMSLINHDSSEGEQSGRYNLLIYIYIYICVCGYIHIQDNIINECFFNINIIYTIYGLLPGRIMLLKPYGFSNMTGSFTLLRSTAPEARWATKPRRFDAGRGPMRAGGPVYIYPWGTPSQEKKSFITII